jgi:PAS domain S-box-containing protein
MAAGHTNDHQRNHRLDNRLWVRLSAVGLAVLGIALTLAFVGIAVHAEHVDEGRLFERTAQGCYESVVRNLEGHMVALEAVRSYMAAADTVDQQRFAAFVAPLMSEVPGIQALEWAPRVDGADLAVFEAAAAGDFAAYRVRGSSEDGALEPVVPAQEHYPVRLVHPLAGNEKAVGFDVASSELRYSALRRARDTGRAAATAPVKLVQETGSQSAYLVFLPVADRGCVLGVFRAGDVLGAALEPLADLPLDITVIDEDTGEDTPLFRRGVPPTDNAATTYSTVDVAGRRWRLAVTSRGSVHGLLPPFGALVLAGGLAVTGFAVTLLLVLARQHAATARLVEQRTRELQSSEDRLRTVADLSSDLVYWRHPDGSLVYVSPAAAAVTGYAAEAIAARPALLADMVHPADREAWLEHERRVMAGDACSIPEFRIVTADGQERWIRHRCRPIRDRQGASLGLRASNTDVTDAKLASVELQRERQLFTGGPVTVLRWRAEEGWPVEYASPNADQVCGEAWDDLRAGRIGFSDLLHADDRAALAADLEAQAAAGRASVECEYRIAAPGLPERTYHAFTVIVRNDGGAVTHYDAYLLDMTERIAARRSLEITSGRLELALTGADLGLWDWDVESGAVFFDERWCSMLGYRPDELQPTVETWADLVHPDDMPRVMHELQRHLEGQTRRYETEHRLRHRSGEWIWVLDRGKVIDRDDNGLPLRAAGTHQDITARRRAEVRDRRAAALRESAAVRLSACTGEQDVLETARDVLAEAGELLGVARGFLLRRDPDDEAYEPVHQWHAEDSEPERPFTAGDLDVLGPWWDEQADGKRATLALDASAGAVPARVGAVLASRATTGLLLLTVPLDHELVYALAFETTEPGASWRVQDIETLRIMLESFGHAHERVHLHTEHADTLRQLEQAFQRAEQANLVKSTFLARMSHEIRTPLTAILGFADILERSRERLSDRDFYWVGQIRSNADHLVALLNDLLDISKIEAKELRVGREPVEIRGAVETVAAAMREKATEKMLAFRVDIADDVPGTVVSDGLRLRQILVNLLGNAVKFTERGSVSLDVRLAAGDDGDAILFTVTDTGIGIAPDQLEAIFQPFQQANGLDHARFGGTGLGLDISRRLARMLGGDLVVISEPGHGSTFTARIPAEVVAPAPAPTPEVKRAAQEAGDEQAAAVDGARVLLVDDNPDNRLIVSFYLEEAGIVPDTAEDGAEAVAAVQAAIADGRPYEVILMDMRMPVMDGYAATKALRDQGVATPIIALTAHAMAGDSQACLNFGCNGYLSKPIEPQTLIETVAAHLPERPAGAPQPQEKVLRSSMENDPRFAPHLERYLAGLGRTLDQLRVALETADAAELESLTHRLHGTGASFGFADISYVAADCENTLRSGGSVDDIRTRVEELADLLAAALRGARRPAAPVNA